MKEKKVMVVLFFGAVYLTFALFFYFFMKIAHIIRGNKYFKGRNQMRARTSTFLSPEKKQKITY